MKIPIQSLLKREIWLKVHTFLALFAGFFFALIALTGSLSVYREELDALLNPILVIEQPAEKYQSLDKIMAAVQAAHPERYGPWTLEMPRSPQGMITAWYDKPRETLFETYAPLMVSVNPYTAEVVAGRFWGQTAATWLLDLHTQLRLDGAGQNAVGFLGLFLMMSVVSGLYLWWPGLRNLITSFKIRHDAGMMKLAFDLHRLLGLFSALILLLLAFTGFNLSFPSVLEKLAGSSGMAHGETGKNILSKAIPNDNPTSLEAAQFIARGPFPHAELRRVTTPAGEMGIYRINLRQDFEVNQRHPFTTVWVDRWSGQIEAVRNPSKFNSAETALTWLWPMHTGEAFGATGRLLWFLTGITVFVLYVSGLMLWLYKQNKLKDRAIDFSALKPGLERLQATAYRAASMLFNLMLLVLKNARKHAPQLMKELKALLQRMRAIMIDLQNLMRNQGP